MKLGIISDTHGSIKRWEEAMTIFKNVDFVLHAGDILNHGPKNPLPLGYEPFNLVKAINESNTPILAVKGNCDSEGDQLLLNILLEVSYVILQDGQIKILLTHGHHFGEKEKIEIASKYKINIFITGHSHQKELIKKKNIIFLNPGSCALPLDKDRVPTVAIIEENKIKIFNLNTSCIIEEMDF